ncbi:NAD(P)H-dependent oxidoreductase [Arthrobacter ginkgonis]|uniref:NAD(P)H-dependent oxidoreductase n=1 Tax=Arthrobacter ginkgonis TaxID=1630594 RepID=A0ABP7C1N5_9MICC
MTSITVLVGNPKPASRTLRVCRAVAERIATAVPRPVVNEIDLADHAPRLFAWPDEGMAELSRLVAESDVVVVGSPTYKGTYTGMLKAFLDRYPKLGLDGVVAVPVMTGADLSHYLGPDVHLRSLLVELGACAPSPALYFTVPRMAELELVLDDWAARSLPHLAAATAVRRAGVLGRD